MGYLEKESTEISSQKKYAYAYNLSNVEDYLDKRDIYTRQHRGILFVIDEVDHYKCGYDPMY